MKILKEFNDGTQDCVVIAKADYNYWENVLELLDKMSDDMLVIRKHLNDLEAKNHKVKEKKH